MTQLFDYAGRPIKPPARPETREIGGVVSIRDRWSSYPSAGLTPSRLTQIFRQADYGYLRDQAELFEEMEEKDCHLAAILQTRKLAVLSLDWEVQPASESAEDQKIADFVREQLEDLALRKALLHLLDAIGKGYAALEILWDTSSGVKAAVSGLKAIPAKNITYVNTLSPRLLTEENLSEGIEFPPFKILYHAYEARSGYAFRNGVLRVAAWMYLFKNYSLKDWAAFNEIFGMPLRLGKYEPSATPADKEALRAAISSLGSDAAGIISKATEIEFVEAKGQGKGSAGISPYEALINHCDRAMSKAVLGQTLTTDTTGGTGTYAAGAVHDEVRGDILEADATAAGETIREQLVWPLVGFNFGWDKALPQLRLVVEEEQDLKADSEWIKNLKEAGAGKWISKSFILKKFGLTEPEKGEETLADAEPEPSEEKIPPAPPLKKEGKEAAAMKASILPGGIVLPPTFEDNGAGDFGSLPEDAIIARVLLELENLSQAFQAAMPPEAAAALLAPVEGVIARGGTPEEIKAGLVQVMKDLNVSGYAEHLAQALMLAELRGRVSSEQ